MINCGPFSRSSKWRAARRHIEQAVLCVDWPAGTGQFTINPIRKGNGVVPIKHNFIAHLLNMDWIRERAPSSTSVLGSLDVVFGNEPYRIGVEWETGNISSSHRALNKLALSIIKGWLQAGVLIMPSRKLYKYLTDRIGNYDEISGYFDLWKALPCTSGVLEIIVVEHDAESVEVRTIPKGTDGRARG